MTTPNKGKGRLTKVQSQLGIIDFVYDARGNITSDTRTINAKIHTTLYTYDAADRVLTMTYPSGRIVTYARDAMGRITGVTTKKDAGSSVVTLASSIDYMPVSRLVKSFTYGNGLIDMNGYTLDYETSALEVKNGAANVCSANLSRTDNLNVTALTDNVTSANTQTFGYSPANRLNSATGAYGAQSWTYDGVGNRTSDTSTPVGGSLTARSYTYPATSNKLSSTVIAAATERAFTYDGAGNIASDTRTGTAYTYAYNKRNRLNTVTVAGSLKGTYTYNGLEQLAIRVSTNQTPSGTTHHHTFRPFTLSATTGTHSRCGQGCL